MTLTAVATLTRRLILVFGILLVFGLILLFAYRIWYARYLASLPKAEDLADTKFGVLPFPHFPSADVSSSNFSYFLATPTGKLPEIAKTIKVYFIPKAFASLLASEKADVLARAFNITVPPQPLSEIKSLYKTQDRKLNIELDTGNFIYQREASSTASPSATRASDLEIIQNFKDFLASLGVLKDEIKQGSAKIKGSQIFIWPPEIDQKPIVTGEFNEGLIKAKFVGNAKELDNYLLIDYIFWPVDTSTFATYPTKYPSQAFDDLKNGKGTVVVKPQSPQVSITSVYLAYFEDVIYTPYLQPVFVFEGPSFVALVPAIDEKSLTTGQSR